MASSKDPQPAPPPEPTPETMAAPATPAPAAAQQPQQQPGGLDANYGKFISDVEKRLKGAGLPHQIEVRVLSEETSAEQPSGRVLVSAEDVGSARQAATFLLYSANDGRQWAFVGDGQDPDTGHTRVVLHVSPLT